MTAETYTVGGIDQGPVDPGPDVTWEVPRWPTLADALAGFQAERPDVDKNQTADVQGKEGKRGYKYGYADLANVEAAVLPVLGRHGLAWTCQIVRDGRDMVVVGRLLHGGSGEEKVSEWPVGGGTAQARGSDITYGKRYMLVAATGCSAGADDDDGAAATASAYDDRREQARPPQQRSAPDERPAPGLGTRRGAADAQAADLLNVPLSELPEVWQRVAAGGNETSKPSDQQAQRIREHLAPYEIPADSEPGKQLALATGTLAQIAAFRLMLESWQAVAFKAAKSAADADKAYMALVQLQPRFAGMTVSTGQKLGDWLAVGANVARLAANSDPAQASGPPWDSTDRNPAAEAEALAAVDNLAATLAAEAAADRGDGEVPWHEGPGAEPWDQPDAGRPAFLDGTN